jgi:multidrug efflux pump subunit AcrB
MRLSAAATVTDSAADPSQVALLDGVPVVAFSISRTRGSSEVEVAKGVRADARQLQREQPDLAFQLVTSTSRKPSAATTPR